MRIIHVSDCFLPMLGGIEMQVSELARKQVELGSDVTVLTSAAQKGGSALDKDLPYRVVRSVWPNPFGAPVDPKAPGRFYDLIRRAKPDVVHLHMGELTPVVLALLWKMRRNGIPTVVTVHSVWNPKVTVPAFRFLGSGFADLPVAWTGVSQLVASRVGQVVGEQNVRVLPNGVESDRWQAEPVEHEGMVAVTAARFAPRKRIPALLNALARAADSLPPGNLTAVIAGDGPGWKAASRWVDRRGLADVIALPGRLSSQELRDLYRGADVFISPSVNEAASIAAAEAQAAGLAVLTRSQSGLGERITSSEGAAVLDDAELSRVLTHWATNQQVLERKKAHNRETLCPLDWQLVLPQVYDTYDWAMSRAKAAR